MKVRNYDGCKQLTTLPRLFPINCYLVEEQDGLTLIDAGVARNIDKLIRIIRDEVMPLKRIVFTHAHSDHIGDPQRLHEAFPDAQFYLSKGEDYESERMHDLTDSVRIGSLQAIMTPGHTKGSFSFLDTRNNDIFVGDLIQTRGGAAICGDFVLLFPFPGSATWNPLISVTSFDDLAQYQPRYLYCGHGNRILYNDTRLEKSKQRILKKK